MSTALSSSARSRAEILVREAFLLQGSELPVLNQHGPDSVPLLHPYPYEDRDPALARRDPGGPRGALRDPEHALSVAMPEGRHGRRQAFPKVGISEGGTR
ncbi:hypothetical protein [Streptomyces blattellae]|uniref:hypothetical protein n=1 Tax=Streptomyces blattellae TaxID=2569855 RepID=UPI0018AC9C29|nr:hypothetical protein [Streptomyces blattellae]